MLNYVTFIVWNVAYYLLWQDWELAPSSEHEKVKPKTSDARLRIIESVNQFSSAGVTAVSILLPTDAAIVGFFFGKLPIGGLLEAAFYLTVSLTVAMWNLSRLPTMAHEEETNVAYNRWTAYFQMLQLSTLTLGIVRLLIALFTLGAG